MKCRMVVNKYSRVGFLIALLGSVTGVRAETAPAPTNDAEVIKATYNVKDMDRFKLAPRSNEKPVDLNSSVGRKRLAEAAEMRDYRREKILNNIVSDKQVAEAWLKKMETRTDTNKKQKDNLKELRGILLPDEQIMKARLAEKEKGESKNGLFSFLGKKQPTAGSAATAVIEPEQLETAYRKAFHDEMKKKVGKFINETEGAVL